ncbi:MAG TPA: uL30 family ribosomal protein [Candidatus Nanoarchaeia archaeon]|nr:uL30 family ribosomal protein [Candidatus Nanoarchaeia archaeon]
MAEKTKPQSQKLAVILVRGMVSMTKSMKDTLEMLRLSHKNYCVVVDNTPAMVGMLKKVKDFVTWGEISEAAFKELVDKRGEEYLGRTTDSKKKYDYKTLEIDGRKYKPYFRLNPPRKGFGRKGIKVSFRASGGLGYRADKINDLIKRMV